MSTFTTATTYEVITCPTHGCGVTLAITKAFATRRRNDGKTFYCLWGHTLSYGETREDELKREAVLLRQQLDQAEAEARNARLHAIAQKRSAAAYRGHLTRIRRRIAHGVCPCCRRTFKQVRQHIKNKHPELVEKWGREVLDG